MHLSERELAAVTHGETFPLSAEAATHLSACAECSAKLEAMRRADREVADLLRYLDHPAPAQGSREFHTHSPSPRRRVAAVVAGLAVAAAAAAAAANVPGWPLHNFLSHALGGRGESKASAPVRQRTLRDQKAGVAFIPGGTLNVRFKNAESGGQVRIVLVSAAQVSAVAAGEASFSVHQSELEIDNRGKAMSFTLEIPRSVQEVHVRAGSRVLFERRDGMSSVAPDQTGAYNFDLGETGRAKAPRNAR